MMTKIHKLEFKLSISRESAEFWRNQWETEHKKVVNLKRKLKRATNEKPREAARGFRG